MLFMASIIWACFMTFVVFAAISSPGMPFSIFIILAAIGYAPLLLASRRRKAQRASWDRAYAGALAALGAEGKVYEHLERKTGILLAPGSKRLALIVGKDFKAYDYADVREWVAQKVSSRGSAVGYGVVGTIAAGSANVGASMAADRETGLFVTVRDIGHPKWRISMFGEADRARWMEILRQEINEGGIAA